MPKVILPYEIPPNDPRPPWQSYIKAFARAWVFQGWLVGNVIFLGVLGFITIWVAFPLWLWIAAVLLAILIVSFTAWYPLAQQRDTQRKRAAFYQADSESVRRDYMDFQYVDSAIKAGRQLISGPGQMAMNAINSNVINSDEEADLRFRADRWFEETHAKLPSDFRERFNEESGYASHGQPAPYPAERLSLKAILHNVKQGITILEGMEAEIRTSLLAGHQYRDSHDPG